MRYFLEIKHKTSKKSQNIVFLKMEKPLPRVSFDDILELKLGTGKSIDNLIDSLHCSILV